MKPVNVKVCIIGLGPAGLATALRLANSPLAKDTVCLEAGVAASARFCTVLAGKGCRKVEPCQITTGVGGSSVLSGGKISAFPAGRALHSVFGDESKTRASLMNALTIFQSYVPLISPRFSDAVRQEAIQQYHEKGFEFRYYDAFLYHRTTLVDGYNKMLQEVKDSGVSVCLKTRVERIDIVDGKFHILADSEGKEREFIADQLVVAVGRFGTELLAEINANLGLGGQPNSCDVGVRLEFPTSLWPDIDYCHNDLKLHFGDARTFCVCKNGHVAPYRHGDIFLLEGSDNIDTVTGFTNLAITVRINPSETANEQTILSEVRQRLLLQTRGKPVRQTLTDYLEGHLNISQVRGTTAAASSITYWGWGNINACFPEGVADRVRNAVAYFTSRLIPEDLYSAVSVFAPEVDYYWPRFPLLPGFESLREQLYIVGESSGQFRGILQAFCSGYSCAESIIEHEYVS